MTYGRVHDTGATKNGFEFTRLPLFRKRVPVHTFSRGIVVGMMPTHGQAAI